MYRSRFEKELEQLNTNLIRLGGLIEQVIYKSIDALIKQDKGLAVEVIASEKELGNLARIIGTKLIVIPNMADKTKEMVRAA